MTSISFRHQLKGAVSDFLKAEQMHCVHTEEGLLELVVALSSYTEEVTCPPKRYPGVMLDFEKKKGGQNGKEGIHYGTDHK